MFGHGPQVGDLVKTSRGDGEVILWDGNIMVLLNNGSRIALHEVTEISCRAGSRWHGTT